MRVHKYGGSERRRFRRVELHHSGAIEAPSSSIKPDASVFAGETVNLSYGGALVRIPGDVTLPGATPVRVEFSDTDSATPPQPSAVVWRAPQAGGVGESYLALEFEQPLLAYEGAVELADRLDWLCRMGGEELRDQVVTRFLDSTPEEIHTVAERCQRGDLEGIVEILRGIKSAAGHIGAVNLYEVARRAERAAHAGDAASAGRMIELLREYFVAVKTDLQRLGMR